MVDVSTPTLAKKCRTDGTVATAAPFSDGLILAESAQTKLPAGTTAQTERPPSAAGSVSEWPKPGTPGETSTAFSDKYGKKCCRYNQNGQPLPKEVVHEMYKINEKFLNDWKISEDARKIYRYYYTEDYPSAVQFIKEVAKIDVLSTKNCPSFHLTDVDFLFRDKY